MHGAGNLTPTQLASHERSKAFKAKIAEQAEKLAPKKSEVLFREAAPFCAEAIVQAPPSEVLPPIPNEALQEACKFVVPTVNQFGPKVDIIAKTVASYFGVSYADIISSRRTRNVCRPRQIAMYLAKTLTTRSLPFIGRQMGDRDHTTVIHAVRKIEAMVEGDPDFAAKIAELKEMLA